MPSIRVTLWQEHGGWWTACLEGKSSPILRQVPGNTRPASRATWRTQEEAEKELPELLGAEVEVVKVYDLKR